MKTFRSAVGTIALVGFIGSLGCSNTPKSPDVSGNIRDALRQSGLKNVSVSQDRDKGVVTLTGSVASEDEKITATSLAKSIAVSQVVANEIAVLPPGDQSSAKAINSDLDGGIKKNLDAALIERGLHSDVDYDVKNGVVTLTGEVTSQSARNAVQQAAANVPNVQQVVNKLDVKDQRATSSN
jgi:hyperosmotically inducible protein